MSRYPRSEDIVYQDWTFASNAPSNWSQLTSILNRDFDSGSVSSLRSSDDTRGMRDAALPSAKSGSYAYTREFFARRNPDERSATQKVLVQE